MLLRASCAAGRWPDSPHRLQRFLGTCHGVQLWLGVHVSLCLCLRVVC